MADNFTFNSAPFTPGGPIPNEFTCEGDDIPPNLLWTNVPDGTQSLALIVDDPDAPGQTFTHWILFNIPGSETGLPRNIDIDEHFADADPPAAEGTNDFDDIGYGGPCPPPGDDPHRYFFRLYALDTVLDLGQGATRKQLTNAMDGHVLDETDRMGTYQR